MFDHSALVGAAIAAAIAVCALHHGVGQLFAAIADNRKRANARADLDAIAPRVVAVRPREEW